MSIDLLGRVGFRWRSIKAGPTQCALLRMPPSLGVTSHEPGLPPPTPLAAFLLPSAAGFLEREIATTQSSGQLFVVAAGNLGVDLDEVPLYPASYKTDNMISVAASDSSDKLADFSNIGQ